MKNIVKTSELVRYLLTKYPETRNSDDALYVRIVAAIDKNLLDVPFIVLMSHVHDYGLPPYESVRRSRQRMQELHPELRATEKVIKGRKCNQLIVEDYVKQDCQWG